jgi:membrane peptidoglycan carboxypeptidase
VTQAALRAGGKLSALLAFFAVAAIAGTLIACVVTPAVAIAGSATKQQINAFQSLPASLAITPLDQKTRIYAKDGKKQVLLASFFLQNRDVIKWTDLPDTVKNATLAAEDVRFYQHGPIDPSGIARALVSNAMHKDIQGASTISQQYVKNVCVQQAEALTPKKKADAAYLQCIDKSYNRKIREMRLAIGLEKKYSKDEILLGYLNIAGFGGRTYGIEAASEYYYDKKAKDLTIGQAATLISIVNNPDAFRLDRKANLVGAEGRRNYVLGVERSHGMITAADYEKYSTEKIVTKITEPSTGCDTAGSAGFFCDYVQKTILASKEFGKTPTERLANLQTKGWTIYTTLDLDANRAAQKVVNRYVPMSTSAFKVGSAAVSVQVGTGRVLTMAQNKKYRAAGSNSKTTTAVNYSVNNALGSGAGYQPGSTFKAFTLIGWLMSGHTINQTVNANPRTIPGSDFSACGQGMGSWTFKNDTLAEKGNMSVATGTAGSVNGAFASMAEEQDLCKLRTIAQTLGAKNAIGGQLPLVPAMSIGGAGSIAPLDMAVAYAGIANKGVTCSAIGIDKVVDSDGKSLPVPKADCRRAIPANVAVAAAYTLHGVITGGTMGGDQTADGRYLFGKTGTTDDAKHTWAIGSTTKVTTAVWVGNANGGANLRYEYGGGYCRGSQYAVKRHCIWHDIQTILNKQYGGAYSWPTPESQFLYGGKAIVHKDAAPQKAKAKPKASTKDSKPTKTTPVKPKH